MSEIIDDAIIEEKKRPQNKEFYILGEKVNGVMFWRHIGTDKNNNQIGLFVCPCCKELWKSRISDVKSGKSKSCCGRGSHDA